jgi:hypothetical protein
MQPDNLLAGPPQPNIDIALRYLQEMLTNDVWHLVAAQLRGTMETKSFGLNKRGEVHNCFNAKRFICSHQTRR